MVTVVQIYHVFKRYTILLKIINHGKHLSSRKFFVFFVFSVVKNESRLVFLAVYSVPNLRLNACNLGEACDVVGGEGFVVFAVNTEF